MKKLLLSLAVLAATAFGLSAETLTFTGWEFPDADKWNTSYAERVVKFDNATVTFASANKQSGTITDCPVTKGGNITIAANSGQLTSVKFNLKQWATKKQTATLYVSKDGTEFTATETTSDNFVLEATTLPEGTIAAQVQFSSTANQVGLSSIDVTYKEGAATDKKPAGLAWSETTVSLYIDGVADFTAPTLKNPNELAVTYSTSDATVATVTEAGVVALTGKVGEATISAAFAGNDEYMEATASCTIIVKEVPASVASVDATKALETKTDLTVGYELTVGFVNGSNIFACDAAGDFIQVYGKNSYKVGDNIPAGWKATYEFYKDVTPELMPIGSLPAATEGTFTPKEVAAADITTALVNSVVLVKNVEFAEATPATKSNFTGKVGETELSFRNNYEIAGVDAGKYDVTIVVTVFNNAPSLYVVKYAPVQSSGIEDIEVEAGEAVYYNLQGVEVANPENGIYIVRRGNKVTKEVIR